MTGAPDDREVDEFLAGGSRLSRDYRALGREEPPTALDAQIRSIAAAAVKPRRARRPPWGGCGRRHSPRRWYSPYRWC